MAKYDLIADWRHKKNGKWVNNKFIFAKGIEGIKKARAIGRKAIYADPIGTEIHIVKTGSTTYFPKPNTYSPIEVLMHRYTENGRTFVGVVVDRQNVTGGLKHRSLMMVNSDGSIYYDPTIWS